ncbi:MAG: hypothetical protein ABEH43_10365, partial [Flavobacteriales bacterium]
FFIRILPVLFFLSSCSSSHKVITNSPIQKRKYRKGYYVNLNQKSNKDFNKKDHSNIGLPKVKNENSDAKNIKTLTKKNSTFSIKKKKDSVLNNKKAKKDTTNNFKIKNKIDTALQIASEKYFMDSFFSKHYPPEDKKDGEVNEKELKNTLVWVIVLFGLYIVFSFLGYYLLSAATRTPVFDPRTDSYLVMGLFGFPIGLIVTSFFLMKKYIKNKENPKGIIKAFWYIIIAFTIFTLIIHSSILLWIISFII